MLEVEPTDQRSLRTFEAALYKFAHYITLHYITSEMAETGEAYRFVAVGVIPC